MTLTPWKTPLYNRGASLFALSSPCSCNLGDRQRIGRRCFEQVRAPDFDGFEAVGYCYCTACCYAAGYEGAVDRSSAYDTWRESLTASTYPRVVDMLTLYATRRRE